MLLKYDEYIPTRLTVLIHLGHRFYKIRLSMLPEITEKRLLLTEGQLLAG
ncbi:hypothetical protein Xmau_04077 [Xenorhabdus mauleonii]|uniref:Uncharacterized protein n=1 Tax=Xenorhabdus mauleonii TaxID=351675 RepID=A0A1I3VX05_9GAMM|nr:hypothetical protein Xmau_04077 [Xenorhabdus mauleonii]SFJ99669.1 hypothetical protein SAMN05421680_12317 [Xenorhabdus mauleonii]